MAYVKMNDRSGNTVPGLMFSHCQWANLNNITNKSKAAADEALQKAMEIEQRKNLSQQMASTWENTYVNIRKRRYAKRNERLLKEQKYKHERFEELRIESEREMNKLRDKAKAALFFERDACKSFHSAFRTSESEAERLAQLKFNENLKAIEREMEQKYAESVFNDVKKHQEEEEENKRNLDEKKRLLKIQAKEMLKDAEDRKKREKEIKEIEEREDMEIMERQMLQVMENEKNEIMRKKAFEKHNLLENREMVRQFKKRLQQEEDEENMAVQIIANGKMSIARIRKQKEEEMLNAKRNRHRAMTNKLDNEMQEKLRKEEESYQRAIAEKYKLEMDALEKERQYRENLKMERIDARKKYLKDEEERITKERELLKWEIIKRLKRDEINSGFIDKGKEQRRQRALECRQSFIKQIELDIDRKMAEKQEDLDECRRIQELWELGDKEFLQYAERVRDESKTKGRPLFPLDAAIYDYRRSIGVFDKGKNFIWESKLKRPEGIVEMSPCKCENHEIERENCIEVLRTIGREECGCSKRANGI